VVEDAHEVLGRLDQVSAKMDLIYLRMIDDGRARDRRIRFSQFAIALAMMFGLGGLVVGVRGQQAQDRSNRTIAGSRTAACEQFNRQTVAARAGTVASAETFANELAPPPRTAEIEARFAKLVEDETTTAARQFPLRDCSPAGIAAYLRLPS
jgi:hypothetical protein